MDAAKSPWGVFTVGVPGISESVLTRVRGEATDEWYEAEKTDVKILMRCGPPVFAFFDFFGGDGEPVCIEVKDVQNDGLRQHVTEKTDLLPFR